MRSRQFAAIILSLMMCFQAAPVYAQEASAGYPAGAETEITAGKASCQTGITITPKKGVKVTKIKLNKKTVTLTKGKKLKLKASVFPKKAQSKKVVWKSSNTKVAAVSQSGKVTAKKRGTATITCMAKDGSRKKAVCKIKVVNPVSKITLSKTAVTLKKGESVTLGKTVLPKSAGNKTVRWKSSNSTVAFVSSTGKVTAGNAGTAVITCAARDGSGKEAVCRITVYEQTTASQQPSIRTASSGDTSTLVGSTVWVSATGKKYHRINNCGNTNPANARKVTREEAERRGLTKCSKCY